MKAFTAPLRELAEFEEIYKEKRKKPGMLLLSGCVTSQKTHTVSYTHLRAHETS